MLYYIRSVIFRIPELFIPVPFREEFTYRLTDFRADLIAGVTVAVILVPQAMALALIAGLPAIYGLYASLPGFVASLWGSSRHLSTGPVAIVSFLTMTSLIPLAKPGSIEFITLAALLALLVGLIQILVGVLRLGFIIQMIPHSAITGFASAAASIIIITQIPSLFGFEIQSHEFVFQNIIAIIIGLPQTMVFSAILGCSTLFLLFVFKRLPRTFPGTLIILFLGIFIAFLFDLESRGIALIGNIPEALPRFTFPTIDMQSFLSLIPRAAIIALVGFVEAHAIAKMVAAQTKDHLQTNRELVGQGLANIVGGLFQGYPVSGSFLRTAVNVDAGAQTGIAAVITTIVTVIVLLFLSPLLEFLPKTILAAIVIVSTFSLIDFSKLKEIYRTFRTDGIIAYITFGMAFVFKPDDAIFIGILLALILFIRKTVWGVHITEMGIDSEWKVLRDIHDSNRVQTLSETLIVRPGMSLYYANAEHIISNIRSKIIAKRSEKNPIRFLILDFSGVNFIDMTAAELLAELVHDLESTRIHIATIYLNAVVQKALETAPDFPNLTILHNIAEMKSWCQSGTKDLMLNVAPTRPEKLRHV